MAILSVQIMAHPGRADLVADLLTRLDLPETHVTWDERNDRWDTGARAMETYDEDADWHLVLQDDALPCRNLLPGLERALDQVPQQAVVCPYLGSGRPTHWSVAKAADQADVEGAVWIVTRALMWGVGIIVPTYTIDDMLDWCDRKASWPAYDKRVGQYYLRLGWPTWYPWPSLLEHREVPSLINHGDGRVAYRFLGEDVSALDVDWSAGVVYTAGRRSRRLTRV